MHRQNQEVALEYNTQWIEINHHQSKVKEFKKKKEIYFLLCVFFLLIFFPLSFFLSF